MDLAHLYVPQLGSAVHRPSRNQQSVRIERYGNDFACMASVGADQFASDGVPNFGGLVEGSGADLVAVGYVEGHAIDGIFVSLEGVDQIAGVGVPQLAGPIVAARDELVAVLIEAAVGQRQHMSLQLLHQHEFLLALLFDLLDQFFIGECLLLMMVFIWGRLDSVISGSSAMISEMSSSTLVSGERLRRSMHLDSTSPLLRTY